jgi:hypothetical protein
LNTVKPDITMMGFIAIVLLTLSGQARAGLFGDSSYDDCFKRMKSKHGEAVTEDSMEKICRKQFPAMTKLQARGDVKFSCKSLKDEADILSFDVVDANAYMMAGSKDAQKVEFNVLVRKNNVFAIKSRTLQKMNGKDLNIIVDINSGTGKGSIHFADSNQNQFGVTELICSE